MNWEFIRQVGPARWLRRNLVRQFYKALGKEQRLRLPTGTILKIPPGSRFGTEAYLTGANVDWGSEAFLYSLLSRQGALLDVGANIGYYSLYLHPRVKAVYAFEPDPSVRPVLERNLGRYPHCHVIPAAASSRNGEAQFEFGPGGSEISKLSPSGSLRVTTVTIDSFVSRHALKVEAIKIDTEGHDLDVLTGALRTLQDQQPIVLTEATVDARLFSLAHEVGYSVFAFSPGFYGGPPRLTEIEEGSNLGIRTKMAFLVPHRLRARFLT